jgi:phosphoglycolate phosphatase
MDKMTQISVNFQQSARTRRAWDSYDAYLFDIDGTLLNCTDAVHYFAFCDALQQLAGRPLNLDGVTTHGNTDVGILRDALDLASIAEEQWRPRLAQIRASMCRFVQQRGADLCITVCPSVAEVLSHLRARGALLGVATGNLEGIGRLKLDRAGLLDQFDFGGFSDLCEFRSDVFRGALDRIGPLLIDDASVCVVGDTPEDIRAARAQHLDVIAVATGIYRYEELQSENPDWCLHSLRDVLNARTLPSRTPR